MKDEDRQIIAWLFEAKGYLDDAVHRITIDAYSAEDHDKFARLLSELSLLVGERGQRSLVLEATNSKRSAQDADCMTEEDSP